MQALHIVNKIRIVFAWFAAKVATSQIIIVIFESFCLVFDYGFGWSKYLPERALQNNSSRALYSLISLKRMKLFYFLIRKKMILKKKSDLTKTKRIWASPKQPVLWAFSYV